MSSFSLDYYMGLKSSWERLKESRLPIFIYGMGDGAEKILVQLSRFKIPYCGFFASDEFVRGHSFYGHRVHTLKELEEKIPNFIIALAFAAGYDSLIEKLCGLAKRHVVIAPDVPVIGEGLFTKQYLSQHFDEISEVYELLADEKSREVFSGVIEYKITGQIKPLVEISSAPAAVAAELLKLGKHEVYVDAGAYNGDTVAEFLEHTEGCYERIIAIEPDRKNFKKLKKAVGEKCDIEIVNAAVWSEDKVLCFSDKAGRQSSVSEDGKEIRGVTIDKLLNGKAATYIKYDVEGAEEQAILGSRSTIEKFSPKLCVSLYHRNEDIFKLVLLIKKLNSSYRFFIRKYPYIPAWEVNLFCIP